MEWLSINEHTPEPNEYVIVNVPKKKTPDRVFVACYNDTHNMFVVGYKNHERNVSHWMPLPPGVKELQEKLCNGIKNF